MIVVVGAGVASLTAVNRLVKAGADVTLVTAGRFGHDAISAGNTALAQGGIAAALGADDTPALHAADTIRAGAGLVDPLIAQFVATEGAQRMRDLLEAGFAADRNADGTLAFGLEAAHSTSRVVHAGEDSTGAALSRFLTAQVQHHIDAGAVQLVEQASLQHIHTAANHVCGLTVRLPGGSTRLGAEAMILATGGFAGLYSNTSSSAAITGHGVLAAARAGAVLADMEFVQFHPTVIPGTGQLISEAVRGAGAVLRDPTGKRFMPAAHPDAELAPRDVVSRASAQVMRHVGTSSVWLDATVIEQRHGPGTLARRFPVLTQALTVLGIDWSCEQVPVAPAAHYCMGGVATDTAGRTSVAGLYAAGEVASTGFHGANRLASNSLLEGLVFGTRAAGAACADTASARWQPDAGFSKLVATATEVAGATTPRIDSPQQLRKLQQVVDTHLGITRTEADLNAALRQLETIRHPMGDLVRVMATAALRRTESRGGHWRADFPAQDPTRACRTAWRLTTAPSESDDQTQTTRTKETPVHVDA
ncbi:L-aspartate oxidase [Enteractinococcus helveticum]|uniref:L-aspartate oxidase n=1 Tax=Enteractinococcus helveticum TaxID=1837282 RepID=A0A1B7LY88_9MICC|nr:FAD-binding protein [Enteractinococcus helveticum]OAV60266.1 hypothetical protein A6F49_12890 [Enteractinococcus helveticum]